MGTGGSAGSTMNHEQMNGAGANGGPMASGTGTSRSSGMSGGSHMSSNASGSTSSEDVRQAQEALQDQGLYKGQVDGKMGPQTKRAIAQFQKQKGLKQTAQLDQPTLNDLQNGAMSGSDNSSSSPSSRGPIGRSPNGSPGFNSSTGGAASGGASGNGPASTSTNPGGQNRTSTPTH
jgi:peptidoglycan hydrolase-like protein with peptidoglycan-binding domain